MSEFKNVFGVWKQVDRNIVAAGLSVVPGLGHLYKHHYMAGFGLLVMGNVLVGFVSVLMALGTFGVSLLLLPLVWVPAVAWSAYMATDEHGHHPWLHVWEYHWADFVKRIRH